jgi:hypothetical protein
MFPRLAAVAPAALIVHLLGCGGTSEEPSGAEPGATVSCTEDARLDTYAGGLERPGELGVLTFRFSDLEPAPPARGNNVFHVQVNDAAGAALEVELAVDLRMPDHGHGTSVKPVRYTVRPLYLFMPGVWRIEFDAYAPGASAEPALDRVALHFCVEG